MKFKFAVLSAALLLIAQTGSAQAPPASPSGGPPPDGVPDFMKAYMNVPADMPGPSDDPRNMEGGYLHMHFLPRVPPSTMVPFKPEVLAKVKEREKEITQGIQKGTLFDLCRQGGMITEMSLNFPFKILQTDKDFFIVHEEMHSRIHIRMNEKFPKDIPVSYEGYSIGHWEDDTLVVETKGIDRRTYLGLDYVPHGPKLRQTLRIRKLEGGRKLEFVFTFDDPDYYTKVWSPEPIVVDWRPDLGAFAEYDCEETSGTAAQAAKYGVKVDFNEK